MVKFEWDPDKDLSNFKKHGISFEAARFIFEGFHFTQEDTRRDYGERRFLTMGTLENDKRVVIIAYTYRNNKLRVISMRKANLKEQKIFNNYKMKFK
jgi:uncharacterized DUF497 family protein